MPSSSPCSPRARSSRRGRSDAACVAPSYDGLSLAGALDPGAADRLPKPPLPEDLHANHADTLTRAAHGAGGQARFAERPSPACGPCSGWTVAKPRPLAAGIEPACNRHRTSIEPDASRERHELQAGQPGQPERAVARHQGDAPARVCEGCHRHPCWRGTRRSCRPPSAGASRPRSTRAVSWSSWRAGRQGDRWDRGRRHAARHLQLLHQTNLNPMALAGPQSPRRRLIDGEPRSRHAGPSRSS
jgi:hypothetical protein